VQRIATLSGVGKLRTLSADFGVVAYKLDVWQQASGQKQANGSLAADDLAIIRAFASNDPLLLDLQTGGHVTVIITSASIDEGEFKVSGPIPGI
jgi:hypothetical protein